jgi:Fe2+ or Zn2+ uptake regulation protein
MSIMTERRDTVVCVFYHNAQKLSAYEIHEWIFDVLRLPEEQVLVIQIDGQQRKVYINLTDHQAVVKFLQDTSRQVECKHSNEEITHVLLSEAGLGYRRVRVANVPPEEPEDVLRAVLAPYGKVLDIKEKAWTKTYRYVVASGIRQVTMTLTKHVPSNLMIKGTRVLFSYEGQPTTCYGCG